MGDGISCCIVSAEPSQRAPLVTVDRSHDGVAIVALDRPAKRNALNPPMLAELREALRAPGTRAVVIRSTDPGCFCAGADLDLDDPTRARLSDELYELYEELLRLDAPVIAAIGGVAVGGGAQIAVASDLRVGGPSAALRFAGPGHGLAVGAWALPSLVGRGRALDLCLTMRRVESAEALAIGLLDRLVPDPDATALALAQDIARLEPGAAARVKRIARDGSGLLAALADERTGNAAWTGTITDPRSPSHA
jgi:enoyl-CoA hydratase/carnithine racemase